MAALDIDKLLQEVSADAPCGEDLEYDPEFQQMELAAQYKPEQRVGDSVIEGQEPDWREVMKIGTALFARTKDLRVAAYLARAQLNVNGISGFSGGLGVVKGLLENFWDCAHPQLDPEDNNDPTFRVNTVAALCDPETVMRELKAAPLVSAQGIGRFNIRDIDIANGLVSPVSEEQQPQDTAVIDAAFMQCDLEQLQSIANDVKQAIESVTIIESIFTEKVTAAQAPNLSELTKALKHMDSVLGGYLEQRGVSAAEEQTTEAGEAGMENQTAAPVRGDIRSREDVIRMLDKICEYYKNHEPSSPLPLLLQRAKRLVRKDFMEILKDIAPDAVKQAEVIGGSEQ
jgi:type VI secretion system protein ImpA